MERYRGEVFEYKGRQYKIAQSTFDNCNGCAGITSFWLCFFRIGKCRSQHRQDRMPIIAVEQEVINTKK